MYILYSGLAKVQVKGVVVAHLRGGQCFGEMAVLGLVKKRTASIIATTICDIRILSRRSLEDAIKEYPEERSQFEALAAKRHRTTQEKQFGGKITQTSRFFSGSCAKFAEAPSYNIVYRSCLQQKFAQRLISGLCMLGTFLVGVVGGGLLVFRGLGLVKWFFKIKRIPNTTQTSYRMPNRFRRPPKGSPAGACRLKYANKYEPCNPE